ncbi:hypothetical protein [Rhodoligotrophos ferricapiens]|uniref:hypothetical protein n=1 Tax=Rhodoligotrophos ferricapiens TaxID=3069264 RepID=UPI00315CA04D
MRGKTFSVGDVVKLTGSNYLLLDPNEAFQVVALKQRSELFGQQYQIKSLVDGHYRVMAGDQIEPADGGET